MSDWGRTSGASAPTARRGPGILGMIIMLVLGAALGSAGLFFAEHANRSELADKSAEIQAELDAERQRNAELTQQLANQSDAAGDAINLRAVLEEQEKIVNELHDENRSLTAKLDAAQFKSDGSRDVAKVLEDKIGQLEARLSLAGQVNTEMESKLKLAEQVNGDLQSRLDKALNEEIPSLKSDIEKRDETLANLDAEITRLNSRAKADSQDNTEADRKFRELEDSSQAVIASLKQELASVRAEAAARDSEIAALKEANTKLREEIANLATDSPETDANAPDVSPPAVPQADEPVNREPQSSRNQPRDPLLVASALQRAAGLADMDAAQRDRIATRLIEGDCVGKILEDEFGHVPAITMRDLIQALQSDC